uniref:Endonuclease/exonuclease/phosphatase domain-containing protein n=1 Tax=Nothobranchius furzeri TaxID=105023 RepID=A0A8C6LVY0_NOTFU
MSVDNLNKKRVLHLQFKCHWAFGDEAGRMLLLLAEIQGQKMILNNIYVPNFEDPSFFGLLESKISDIGNYPILMAGDFNLVMDGVLDRSTSSQWRSKSASAHLKQYRSLALVDVWKIFNPTAFSEELLPLLY